MQKKEKVLRPTDKEGVREKSTKGSVKTLY
jgi:hypothetical protein